MIHPSLFLNFRKVNTTLVVAIPSSLTPKFYLKTRQFPKTWTIVGFCLQVCGSRTSTENESMTFSLVFHDKPCYRIIFTDSCEIFACLNNWMLLESPLFLSLSLTHTHTLTSLTHTKKNTHSQTHTHTHTTTTTTTTTTTLPKFNSFEL